MAERVLFLLTDLHGAGAQRVSLTLLRHLDRSRFEPHLALLRREGGLLADVPEDVPVHDLAAARLRRSGPRLVALVRALRPRTIFSTLHHVNHFLLLLRPLLPARTRILVREAISADEAIRGRRWRGLSALLYRGLYRTADRVVVQSDAMRDDLAAMGVPRGSMTRIYNPVDVAALRRRAAAAPNPLRDAGPGPHLLAIGRLSPQKGFDLLIRALPALLEREPEARLFVLGGDDHGRKGEREALLDLRAQLGLQSHVELVGFEPNPWSWLIHADLFVLSSRFEGLPNVLLEALALGCPVVALDRPGGTREIMAAVGQPARLVRELDWNPAWFRASADGDAPPDLSAFSLETALPAYEALLTAD